MIALKLRGARQRAGAKNPNYREGRKPFGARPGEQETSARTQELRTQGRTLSAIVATWTSEDRKGRAGERWYEKQIAPILTRANQGVRMARFHARRAGVSQ